jgi:hypothetical protein
VSSQSPNQSPHVYFPSQSQGYHLPQGQPYGSPQFSSGHLFPKQYDVSEQLVDTSGPLSSRPTRPYRSPSVASNNSNYTRGSLNTELHNSELPNEPFPPVFGSSNSRKVYFMPRNEQDFFRAGRVSHKPPSLGSPLMCRRCLLVFGRRLLARRQRTKETTPIIRESSTNNMRSRRFNVLLSYVPILCNISVFVGMHPNCGGFSSTEG